MIELSAPYNLSTATDEECEYIGDQIMNFNAQQVPFTQKTTPIFKNYVIKEEDKIVAGINAVIYHWGILFVDEIFVSESHRHKNLGSYLLTKVINEAKELGSTLVHLDTFDFQAKDFYIKHGFEIFGILEDCPEGHKRYYLKMSLK
jgi:N-acetylglutamate synthase-like GNAT family acetyltransferase